MAKINRVKDLPDWFSLEKYKGAESFNAASWYEQLSYRRQILINNPEYLNIECPKEPKAASMTLWRESTRAKVGALRCAPLAPPLTARLSMATETSPSGITIYQGGLSSNAVSHDDIPIRQASTVDLALQVLTDNLTSSQDKGMQNEYGRWAALSDHCGTSFKILCGNASSLLELDHKPVLLVNLTSSDSALKEAFDAWLKQERAKAQTANRNTQPFYDRWVRHGLLPYLDLLIWEMETDNHIPHRVMSAAVATHDKAESAFSKTTIPLANSLMRDLSGLRALAALEATHLVDPETSQG